MRVQLSVQGKMDMRRKRRVCVYLLLFLAAAVAAVLPGAMARAQDNPGTGPSPLYLPLIAQEGTPVQPVDEPPPPDEPAPPDEIAPPDENAPLPPGSEDAGAAPLAEWLAGRELIGVPLAEWQPPSAPAAEPASVVQYDPTTGQETLLDPVAADAAVTLFGELSGEGIGEIPAEVVDAQGDLAPDAFGGLSLVSSPTSSPWRRVVKVFSTFSNRPGTTYWCTGVLIQPSWVMTYGECVYNRSRSDGWASTIRVVPAYNNGSEPYGSAWSTNPYVFTAWKDNGNFDYAIGWFRLDRPIGALAGWIGAGHDAQNSFFTSNTFNSPGYPSNVSGYNGERMYNRSGTFDTVETNAVLHNTYTAMGGYSGSPAFRTERGGSRTLVFGMRTFYRGTQTGYARITEGKYNAISADIASRTPTQPDLIPLDVQLGRGNVQVGSPLNTISVVIHNESSAAWNKTVTINYYLSTNETISNADRLLASRNVAVSLGALAATRYSQSNFTIPVDVTPGKYWIGVSLSVSDSKPSNNVASGWDAEPITIESPPPSILKVTPAGLTFNAVAGGSVPPAQNLAVAFDGVLPPAWTASDDADWLTLSRTTGTGAATVAVSVNTAGLPPGAHDATITVSAPTADPSSTPKRIRVDLNLAPSALQLSPPTLAFNALVGATQPTTGNVSLAFSGGASPTWSAEPAVDWLRVAPASGAGNARLAVVADPTGLNEGIYTGALLITEVQGGQEAVHSLPVTFTVGYGSGTLQVQPAQIAFSALVGGVNPAAQRLTIAGGVRGWTAVVNQPWLLLDQGVGTVPGSLEVRPNIGGLPAGVHQGQITIQSGEAISTVVKVTLTLGQPNQGTPLLQVQPAQLRFDATVGGSAPAARAVALANLGGGAMPWTAQASKPWLVLGRSSGSGPGDLQIGVKLDGLAVGTHAGQVVVTASGAQGSPQTIDVVLTLQRPPTLAVDGTRLVFSGMAGGAAVPAQSFVVRNAGSGALAWSASEAIPWLTLDKSQGNAPSQVQAVVNTSGLAAGNYQGVITVQSEGAAGSPRQVQVQLLLQPSPLLALAPQTAYIDIEAGQIKTVHAVDIKNARQGTLQWTASEDVPWLTLVETSGSVGAYGRQGLSVRIDATGLLPRDTPYKGQITIVSPNGEASPQTVSVQLMVASKARYCRIPRGGAAFIMNSNKIQMWMENVQVRPTGAGCDLSARVRVTLPQNTSLTLDLSGSVDADNNLTASASANLNLGIAAVTLQLTRGIRINDSLGLTAPGGAWQFAREFGGRKVEFIEELRIGPNGITLAGQKSFNLPDLNWGGFRLTGNKAEIKGSSDGAFLFELSGTMHISAGAANASARMTLVLDQRGVRRGSIADFTLSGVAGLDIEVKDGKITQDRISAASALLRVPKDWGGGEVAVYDVSISNNGSIAIGGGRFRLPDLKVGGDAFRVASLEGEFRSRSGGGYTIRAMGAFGMSGVSDVGDCRMWVDVTLQTGPNGASVMTLATAELAEPFAARAALAHRSAVAISTQAAPDSLDALRLNRLVMGMRCTPGFALGTTGLFLTGVEGTIELSNRLEKIAVKVWIESGVRIGNLAALSAVPQITLRPKPFSLDFDGEVHVLRVPVQRAKVHIDSRNFSAEFHYNLVIVRTSMAVAAGREPGGAFYLRGSGRVDVGLEKGLLLHECFSYPAPTWKNPGRTLRSCVDIPDSNIRLADASASIDLHGMEISVRVAGVRGTARWDFGNGELSFRRGAVGSAISGAEILAARQTWEAVQSGQAVAAAVDSRFAFGPDGDVTVALPVASSLGEVQATSAIDLFTNSVQSDAVFVLLQPPDGPLALRLITPEGVELDPNALPSSVRFLHSATDTGSQSVYTVQAARAGVWKMRVVGDTVHNGYQLYHEFNTPPPALGRARLEPVAGQPDRARIEWQLLAAEPGTRISIYANNGPITYTSTYTDATGRRMAAVGERYAGTPIATNLSSAVNGSLQNHIANLSSLPSGRYSFWLEASGNAGGSVRCYIRADGLGCTRTTAPVATLTLDRAGTFPSAWEPNAEAVTDIKNGEIVLSWPPAPHADVDEYVVRLETTDPLSPTRALLREFIVGSPTIDGRVQTTLSNIEPGHRYWLRIAARDTLSGRTVWSARKAIDTPQPDFVVSGPANGIALLAGGPAQNLTLNVSLSSELPYPITVDADAEQLADGLYVEVPERLVGTAAVDATVAMQVSASLTLEPGTYVLPLVARSGRLVHQVSVKVTVLGAHGRTSYLPVVTR